MTSSTGSIAYNSSDPLQTEFLSALELGETGGSSDAYSMGVGGTNLNGSTADQYGFPQWNGQGSSHAAGAFQFQPGTWDQIAAQYNLNFSNPSDQNAGAWYYAQEQYSQATNGGSLETALQNGDFAQIQSALASAWPSVTGNQANPQGLASALASGQGAPLQGSTAAAPVNSAGSNGSTSSASVVTTVENFFVRFGLIILGGVVVIVALWQLLSNQGVVPSPGQVAKGVGRATAETI